MVKNSSNEYKALLQICASKIKYSLDGQPLAISQAGGYIRSHECSFTQYLYYFQKASETENMEKILLNSKDSGMVQKDQTSILSVYLILY